MKYIPQRIEKKWQKIWERFGLYRTLDKVKRKKNFYCLDMFPYPSGEGLHVGHLRGYIGSDLIARYFRMKGFNVLHPMGFDAFGLPAENAAIKFGIHPKVWTWRNINRMRKQLKLIGASYDWEREIITSDPQYYKWTQWMFLEFYKKGLAYRAKIPANFCPSCKTILANEQIIEGKCERCNCEVYQKEIEQWLFKITNFAEDLLKDLKNLDWPETTKLIQKNWIGKSEGWEIKFKIKNSKSEILIFTTRVDTLFGATYLVLAPEHEIVQKLKNKISNFKYVKKYIERSKKKTERERISLDKEKTGIKLKGIKAINPANGREIPIFVADYVLIHYATGAIMAVPAHDQRDFDFAKKYNLPIIEVIHPKKPAPLHLKRAPLIVSEHLYRKAFEGEGILINSGRFSGLKSNLARERIGEWLAKRGLARKRVYYHLRDWVISRQRYWGAPIPMILCPNCGWQPVSQKDLPVLLPKIKKFLPTSEGKSPLTRSKKFVQTSCPKCKALAQRETDTLDTFVCSSWYFLRYVDPKNEKKFARKKNINLWLPVNVYVGGVEHAVGHLLYSRFFIKVLKKLNHLNFSEPFLKLRHPGIILGPDHQKMSKSRGNVIAPEGVIKKYGVDSLRLYEMFMGPFGETMAWKVQGIEGCYRFLQKVWKLKEKVKRKLNSKIKNLDLKKLIHKTIKKVTEDIENFRFNTAISALMILANKMQNQPEIQASDFKILLLLLAPFAPHLSEEIWQIISGRKSFEVWHSIHRQGWPRYDPKLIKEEKILLIVQVNGKVRDRIEVEAAISKKKAQQLAFSREKVKKWIEGKKIKKIIFLPKKLINIVT